jgi:hypothetical protein
LEEHATSAFRERGKKKQQQQTNKQTHVKAGGKQINQLAEILDYIGNRREMEDRKSVPVGFPVGQNELPVPTGCQAQPSKPIGDKNRITSLCLSQV